jgi:hypothetical protein
VGFSNLFNFANFDLPGNMLSGLLTGGAGQINGTTPQQHERLHLAGIADLIEAPEIHCGPSMVTFDNYIPSGHILSASGEALVVWLLSHRERETASQHANGDEYTKRHDTAWDRTSGRSPLPAENQ